MIGMAVQDLAAAVDLFGQHGADQHMGPGDAAKADQQAGRLA